MCPDTEITCKGNYENSEIVSWRGNDSLNMERNMKRDTERNMKRNKREINRFDLWFMNMERKWRETWERMERKWLSEWMTLWIWFCFSRLLKVIISVLVADCDFVLFILFFSMQSNLCSQYNLAAEWKW